ncbi:MAG: hypothetical protein WC264_00460 [Candidatus Paceibacterota bacterium]|jgi:hypothetical protein
MKKSIFITGIAGSGKTTICHQLNKIGYKAYDIEATKGLFKTFYRDNSKSNKHNNDNLNEVKNREWICDIKKLKSFMKRRNALFVGAQGLSLVYGYEKEKFPKDKWIFSFDKKKALWKAPDGNIMVPFMAAHFYGNFEFCLSKFRDNLYPHGYCIICFFKK